LKKYRGMEREMRGLKYSSCQQLKRLNRSSMRAALTPKYANRLAASWVEQAGHQVGWLAALGAAGRNRVRLVF
jgi:hypothetical protein